jgi:hypothetical protein
MRECMTSLRSTRSHPPLSWKGLDKPLEEWDCFPKGNNFDVKAVKPWSGVHKDV